MYTFLPDPANFFFSISWTSFVTWQLQSAVGVVWCGVVWCGVVWCGVVCCAVVWWGCWGASPDLPYDALAVGACVKATLLQKSYCCFENPIQQRIHSCRPQVNMVMITTSVTYTSHRQISRPSACHASFDRQALKVGMTGDKGFSNSGKYVKGRCMQRLKSHTAWRD